MSQYLYRLQSVNCAWSTIAKNISLIEDPVYSSLVDTELYLEVYGKLLETLDGDGEDSKVSFFFDISPINFSALVFRSDEAKLFFREEAEELNLIPKLIEICEGETQAEKMKRTQSEKNIDSEHIQKQRQTENLKRIKSESDVDKKQKIINSAQKQLEKLILELALIDQSQSDGDNIKKKRIEIKINKIKDQLLNSSF